MDPYARFTRYFALNSKNAKFHSIVMIFLTARDDGQKARLNSARLAMMGKFIGVIFRLSLILWFQVRLKSPFALALAL